jgi:hypothetical protein
MNGSQTGLKIVLLSALEVGFNRGRCDYELIEVLAASVLTSVRRQSGAEVLLIGRSPVRRDADGQRNGGMVT